MERPDNPEYISIDPLHHDDYNKDDGPPSRSEENDDVGLSHYYDGETMNSEAELERNYYKPTNPSEHHPLPVYYDAFPMENIEAGPINPLHPLDPTRRKTPGPELAKPIKPVKKYVEYSGAHYL